jgi:hypothetical protein
MKSSNVLIVLFWIIIVFFGVTLAAGLFTLLSGGSIDKGTWGIIIFAASALASTYHKLSLNEKN